MFLNFSQITNYRKFRTRSVPMESVLDLVSQVRDVVLMSVYIFGSGKPRGVRILEWRGI